jgi:GntR family transcriptional regulator, transcriptional repressor for pyruvate dehydrogenase complex
MLEKIERVKLSDEILYRLKELIKTGKYGYGDKLPVEKQLAEIFGVSRTTVREALAVLEAEGWVTTKRGNGSYVKRVHNQDPVEPITTLLGGKNTDILELMEIRKVLEREVAMLAALRATPEDLVAINAAYQAMVDAISQGQDTADTDYAIHYAIAKAAKNDTILTIISSLRDLYDKVIKTNRGHWAKPLSYELILSEHKAIIQAIEKRQGTAARKAMDNHLERAHRISEEVLLNISGSKGDK